MSEVVVIIPARYGSTRFPGKVLVPLWGKPLVQHAYESALTSGVGEVYVATDDERVYEKVEEFGGKAILTDPSHPSGTDRVAEASEILNLDPETIIINLQADQPLFPSEYFGTLVRVFEVCKGASVATLAAPIKDKEELNNPNKVKVVLNKQGFALYFSRSCIPYPRAELKSYEYLKHIGVYAYTKRFLSTFVKLGEGDLERIEKLEQLRVLEHGYKIGVAVVDSAPPEVDTPEDLDYILKNFKKPRR